MKISYIKFRCTLEEKGAIQKQAVKMRRSLSQYCREQALAGKVFQAPKLTAAEEEYFKNLHIFHSNFVRLSNYIKYKNPELENEIHKFLNEFRRVTDKFFPR